jgi:hypothetical protein
MKKKISLIRQIEKEWKDEPDNLVVNVTLGELREIVSWLK